MFVNKKKNLNILLYFFLLFSLIILIIYKTPGIKGGIDQELRILTNTPIIIDGRFPIKDSIPNIKYAIKDFLNFKKKKFETIKIDINFKNFDILKKDRAKALKKGMLENPTRVNLDLIWNGKKISSLARLKGDFNDHRNFNKQWSLKFNLRNSENIDGMTEFSITNHRSRNFPYNFIISKNLERMGLHVPKFKTVKVNFNGYDWGIMLAEEHFTKEFLENRKLKNNLIFKLSDEQIMKFEHFYRYKGIIDNIEFKILTKWQDKFNVFYHNQRNLFKKELNYEKKDFIKKLSLMKSINEELNLNNKNISDEIIEKYFDLKSFANMLVSSLAWGESQLHSMELNNARFYINPYTLKISPIPADYEFIFKTYGIERNDISQVLNIATSQLLSLPPLYHSIFKNEKFQYFFMESLNEFEANLQNINNDTKEICSNYSEICNRKVELFKLKKNLANLKLIKNKIFKLYVKEHDRELNLHAENSENYLKKTDLNQESYFNLYNEHIYARLYKNGDLKLVNLTSTDLYIDSLEIEKINFKKKIDLKIKRSKVIKANSINLNLNFNPKINSIVKINYSFNKNGTKKTYETFVENNIDLIENKNNFYNFEKNQILVKENNIIFQDKNYKINKPILVPENYNLIILDGANLLFSKNSYILINNGALKILGKKDNKINITALENTWRGIHVIGNGKKSEIKHANFSKLNYFHNDKFNLTGAINFYNSNVEISNSLFHETNSEDSVNFIKSKFYVNNTTFSKSISDAIDSDFSSGKIENSKFIDISGDAIDTSGSVVEVKETEIFNVGDKGISVGEDSSVKVSNILIDNAKIGIASKDSSKVTGNNILIKNSRAYDLASYNKKKIYEGGKIELTKIVTDNKFLSQKNSIIEIDKKKIIENEFNTKDLY